VTQARGSELTPLEVASGLVFGVERERDIAPRRAQAPRAVMEAAVLPALRHPPCLVSFSGGRDSSCVLALAAHVARREGLRLPVPVTLRFPELAEANEDAWQERVVATLGLDDWVRLEPGDALDAVGPVATTVLRRHGLLWPFNAYVHVPLLESARGGALLTGVGGDELFELMTPGRVHAVLARRARPVPRDLLRLGLSVAPWRTRRAVLKRRATLRLAWLRPRAQRALDAAMATESALEPFRLAARAAWWLRRRSMRVNLRSLAVLADAERVLVVHPLAQPGLASAILGDPQLAFAGRAGRLKAIFGDLLPQDVYERRSKASFNRAFFGAHSRALADEWEPAEVDEELVDVDALRAVWQEQAPDGRTFTLLQSIWLGRHERASTEATRGGASSPPRATTSIEAAEARMRARQPG
jgi:asparagine synthase (glutamine-hydrolysing)